jgi:hypothetical protein
MVKVPGVAIMVDTAMTLRTQIDLTIVSKPSHADVILPVVSAMPAPITIVASTT